jgi:hypothetical protein
MRRQVEAQRVGASAVMVKLKVPDGVTHIHLMDGQLAGVRPDRTIDVSEENAKPLLAVGYHRAPL